MNADKLKKDSDKAKSKIMEKIHMKYISAHEVAIKQKKTLAEKGIFCVKTY